MYREALRARHLGPGDAGAASAALAGARDSRRRDRGHHQGSAGRGARQLAHAVHVQRRSDLPVVSRERAPAVWHAASRADGDRAWQAAWPSSGATWPADFFLGVDLLVGSMLVNFLFMACAILTFSSSESGPVSAGALRRLAPGPRPHRRRRRRHARPAADGPGRWRRTRRQAVVPQIHHELARRDGHRLASSSGRPGTGFGERASTRARRSSACCRRNDRWVRPPSDPGLTPIRP